jgi:hypothetical protein
MTQARKSRAEEAAKVFFGLIVPRAGWDDGHPTKALILAAFELYERAWAGTYGWDVRDWAWPANTIRSGESFTGDEPWTVLLRRAVEIAKA